MNQWKNHILWISFLIGRVSTTPQKGRKQNTGDTRIQNFNNDNKFQNLFIRNKLTSLTLQNFDIKSYFTNYFTEYFVCWVVVCTIVNQRLRSNRLVDYWPMKGLAVWNCQFSLDLYASLAFCPHRRQGILYRILTRGSF